MNDDVLTSERILEVAEEVLRRFGPTKTTVVDVARALGVSHGSVYRHFASKAALRDAVAKRWLHRIVEQLEVVVAEDTPAPERLHKWLKVLMAAKQHKVLDDPELFETYNVLAKEAREVVKEHLETMVSQLSQIIEDGVAHGEFAQVDPNAMAWAVLNATTRFHSPAHASDWIEPHISVAFEGVWSLILLGLQPRKV